MIELCNVSKRYRDTEALVNVNLTFHAGEIHALIGNNGAGKTTAIQLLAGISQPSSGTIRLDGRPVRLTSPLEARRFGIAVCPQEVSLFDELTVTENLFMGNERKTKAGFFDWRTMDAEAQRQLDSFHIDACPRQKFKLLPLAQQHLIQFLRITLQDPRIVILDELTDIFTPSESRSIHQIMSSLRQRGVTVIYVTHRIREALRLADRLTVLKDGHVACSVSTREASADTFGNLLLTQSDTARLPKLAVRRSQKVLEVSGISTHFLNDISFSLYSGEALGIAGLAGSGRSSLLRAIAGVDPVQKGDISIYSTLDHSFSHVKGICSSIAYMPENMDEQALFPAMSTASNIVMRNLSRIAHAGLVRPLDERIAGQKYADMLGIRTSNVLEPVRWLSNGNKQKALIARSLFSCCSVFVFDEATKGVDSVGKVEIYNIINELLRKGAGVLLVSSDFEELIGMCDRLLVIQNGRLIAEMDRSEANQHKLLSLLDSSA